MNVVNTQPSHLVYVVVLAFLYVLRLFALFSIYSYHISMLCVFVGILRCHLLYIFFGLIPFPITMQFLHAVCFRSTDSTHFPTLLLANSYTFGMLLLASIQYYRQSICILMVPLYFCVRRCYDLLCHYLLNQNLVCQNE